jgi:hypothetical protein
VLTGPNATQEPSLFNEHRRVDTISLYLKIEANPASETFWLCISGSIKGSVINPYYHIFIHSSMALQPFVGPWLLFQFRNLFTQTGRFLGREISPSQGLYLHTGQHKHRIYTHTHTDINASSGIRTHDLSFQASEDSSFLRPCGNCDRLLSYLHIYCTVISVKRPRKTTNRNTRDVN